MNIHGILTSLILGFSILSCHAALPDASTAQQPAAPASVSLSPLFSDHAVLQREKPVPVWGAAKPGEKVTVSFAGKDYPTTADAQGNWKISLDSMPASSEPRDLSIHSESGGSVVLKDILVGEVWVASGQSNMGFQLSGATNAPAEIAAANFPQIRQFMVPHAGSLTPKTTVSGNWQVCSPETAGHFTAVGYFFARDLCQKLGVPVGIVHTSFGGTPAEAWTSREALNAVPGLKTMADEQIAKMEKAPADQAAWPAAMAAWEAANGVEDKTNEGLSKGWAAPDFDDSAWTKVTNGFSIASALKATNGGILWARKEVTLPASAVGKPAKVSLGYLNEEYDTVYFNGVEVAREGTNSPLFYSSPRGANIPANLVKEGRNVIALRLVSHTPQGGLFVKSDRMELPVTDPKSVDNSWKVSLEREFSPLSKEVLATRPPLNKSQIQTTATGLFNAMISPVIPYAMRGVIWYQGESNTGSLDQSEQYKTLFPTLIADWRARWGGGDFPFIFVQLANNGTPDRTQRENSWAVLREAQTQTLAKSPNTGMAVAIDVGSDITIHPTDKQDVGQRLALWARAKTYGEKGLVYQSPLYKSYAVEGSKIRVLFDTGGSPLIVGKKEGLNPVVETPTAKLDRFEIAGADGKYVWADALIDGESVVVSSPEVPNPVSVRYAWTTNPQGCNLYNKAGLPASPFRTGVVTAPSPSPAKSTNAL
jgi:sialate O-acetylesterase